MAFKLEKVNFDDVADGKSILEVYRILIDRRLIEPFREGKPMGLNEVLRAESCPELGFRKGILPDHVKNVSAEKDQVVLSYAGRLNHQSEKKYWEGQGYSARQVKKSLEIFNDEGAIATYGLNRVLIEKDRLDEFIEHMR